MSHPHHPLIIWLTCLCALILAMVVIGGITRLTGSGLSIVDWNPIMGAIPPLNHAQWQATFLKYQQYPQYKLVNSTMTLDQFQYIFFWEYFHRLLGRFIGIVFLIPWLFFTLSRRMNSKLALQTGIGFVLGALQGVIGWYMVKSGLVDQPHVSHYRLALHLSLALALCGYFFWILLGLLFPTVEKHHPMSSKTMPILATFLIILTFLQIIYGAFMAGLKAGLVSQTFPKINGQWFPDNFFSLTPSWLNFFDNPFAIQFIHRTLAWILLFSILAFWKFFKPNTSFQKQASHALLGITFFQFALGISTLILGVPISLAVLHQLGASLLFLSAIVLRRSLLY